MSELSALWNYTGNSDMTGKELSCLDSREHSASWLKFDLGVSACSRMSEAVICRKSDHIPQDTEYLS